MNSRSRFIFVVVSIFFCIGVRSMARSKIKVEKGKLADYRSRRNFTITKEPKGRAHKKSIQDPIFVIQKHKARTLHYDFRLEIDGVLKSWSIPKGPSTNPSRKRLAIPTEDYPLEYAKFEGVIPKGEYGAGPVMVWDIGTYVNIKRDKRGKLMPIKKCYEQGHIEVYLEGEKLYGDYALIRTERIKDGEYNWLLIKIKDDYASTHDDPIARQKKSALTDRSLTQIQREGFEAESK